MKITRLTTFQDLLQVLTDEHVPHAADPATQSVEISGKTGLGPLVVRWEKTLPYVQIIQPMVRNIPANRLAEIEHGICRANGFAPLPGFGYEYDRHFLYMRLCVPMFEEGMLTQSFNRLLWSAVQVATDFLAAFQKVADGTATGEQVVPLAIAGRSGN